MEVATERILELEARESWTNREHMERIAELVEARAMAGAGPWSVGPSTLAATDRLIAHAYESLRKPWGLPRWMREDASSLTVREDAASLTVGASSELDLMLQTVEWRRETQIGQMEFTRWGIQQIILIARLYYLKNPIIRRLVDVCAAYVFARGVEVSSPDEAVNAIINQFVADNTKILGHVALTKLERSKDLDGNIFFVFFDDKLDSGKSTLRTIDPTEIDRIETDPDDVDTPWYYLRVCSQRVFDQVTGVTKTQSLRKWYPALGYEPEGERPDKIGDDEVLWDNPVYHSKCGEVGKWQRGCPRAYPALEWARESKKYLEACASTAQSNAQIARDITTKGGQQAIMGIKQQLGTTVGPGSTLWDSNPSALFGSTWVSGPGTTQKLVNQRGQSQDPEEVRRIMQMSIMVFGVPETFLGDSKTGNHATAQSLDRDVETTILEKQEAWRQDLMILTLHHLGVSARAPNGRLQEVLSERGMSANDVVIRESMRVKSKDGKRMIYAPISTREVGGHIRLFEANREVKANELLVRVNFPNIREGDMKTNVDARIAAMTLGNRAGQTVGIDQKEGLRGLYDDLGYENGDEIVENQYPESEYEIDRTKEIETPPLGKAKPLPGGVPEQQAEQEAQKEEAPMKEALLRLGEAARKAANVR